MVRKTIHVLDAKAHKAPVIVSAWLDARKDALFAGPCGDATVLGG